VPRLRDPFSQALESLRDRVMRGEFAPGAPVVIVEEARRLQISTTPVREALAWLCGEGLMERAPRAGYLTPRLDAALLRDRLWVRFSTLKTSLGLVQTLPGVGRADDGAEAESAVRNLFDSLVRATGNHALVDAFHRVDAQLQMMHRAEADVFADVDTEARGLLEVERGGSNPELLAAIDAYHHRRIENAAFIVLGAERRWRPTGERP